MTAREPLDRLTIKAALLIGFGLTFGLWLFAGYQFTSRMAAVQEEAAAITSRYIHSQDLLATIRAQILLGSVYVRDALLDPDPATVPDYRRQVLETYRTIDAALQQYVPVLDADTERQQFVGLRREIEEFQATMLDVLEGDGTLRPTQAREVLQRRVVPKREGVIRMSEEVQALNRGAYVRQQASTARIYTATQRRVWQQLGLALAASFFIGLLATRYAGRLESRLRQQREKEVENARDLQRLSAKLVTAQEEERRTIARELHDEVGQALTAIKIELAVAQRAIDAAGGPRALEDARALADLALHTVRDLSHLLHPAILDDLGLPAAIEWYLKGFSRRSGVRTELLHDGMEQRLAADTEAAAYRIIQEALTNVARHADATFCRVFLQRLPHTVLLTVEDNGKGFDPSATGHAVTDRGLGLIGIRERVAQCRGTLRIESSPGRGTQMTVELPARVRTEVPDTELTEAAAPVSAPSEAIGG